MREVQMIFGPDGRTMHWHEPEDRTSGSVPDSRDVWEFMWEHRQKIGGMAHTHPWPGEPWYSHEDVTTFAALENGLGRRLLWAVVTMDRVGFFAWAGPGRLDYVAVDPGDLLAGNLDVEGLRERSRR